MILHRTYPAQVLVQAALLTFAAAAAIASPLSPVHTVAARSPAVVDFTRKIQPLLQAHCLQCHGADQSGGLRLDGKAFVIKGGASGPAIVPGHSDRSLLIQRVLGQGGKPRMPLGFGPLSSADTDLLRHWIDEGAPWAAAAPARKHWAYIAPVRPRIPAVRNRAWIRNPIDAFVLSRLEKLGLAPSPEADRITLIRRVSLDLTGLPPTPAEVDAFLADRSPNAYGKVVDRLLASPHYGERMALPWLDAARYADSNGFQQDGDTYQYLWRDWVVQALNQNLPFDRFTIEQLAGDLLPHATDRDRLATGFNRNHMLNGEGGAIPEEQRNVILFDRVDVTATTFLGITLACAQCHDHKYDPFTQRDYYSFLAFFNNVPESGVPPGGGQYRIADPAMTLGSVMQMAKLSELTSEAAAARARMDAYETAHRQELAADQSNWEKVTLAARTAPPRTDDWHAAGPFAAASFDAAYDTAFPPEQHVDLGASYQNGAVRWAPHPEWTDGAPHDLTGENSATYLYRVIHADRETPATFFFGSDDAIKGWVNGVPVLTDKVTRGVAPDQEKVTVQLHPGDNPLLVKIVNGGGATGFYFRLQTSGPPPDIFAVLNTPPPARSAEAAQKLRAYFLSSDPPASFRELKNQAAALEKQRDDYRSSLPRVMVMSDSQPRKTHILLRGSYLTPGDEVHADTPACLPPMPPGAPRNRLGLAEWIVSPQNPLTARAQVNRYWQLFFGTGLVKTSENLGIQGERPPNQDLLDWLAVEFRENGWNVKKIIRLIVTSATYRQSSRISPEMRLRDPENRLLARASRFRLPSLLLRDIALSASGLLTDKVGGKPVYPYQPKGIWDGLAITNERDFTYPQSKGSDLYRRSLYTFWRRTVAPADMFDASTRTTCKVRLAVTSTPLHALTTLNDPIWVEASRALAEHVMKGAGSGPDARLTEAFRRVCSRRPTAWELQILRRGLTRALAAYRADPAAAKALLSVGDSPDDPALDPAEHAAYAAVCLAIFNLDEALSHE